MTHPQLADYPARLLAIADDLDLHIPRAGQLLIADRLRHYAVELEALAIAYEGRDAIHKREPT
jgi:hypothetical protein